MVSVKDFMDKITIREQIKLHTKFHINFLLPCPEQYSLLYADLSSLVTLLLC